MRLPSGSLEELRAMAQAFTAQPKAVFLAVVEQPPSVLLAVSEDSGIDAGQAVKAAVAAAGGRGGGTPRIAQGSVPSADCWLNWWPHSPPETVFHTSRSPDDTR